MKTTRYILMLFLAVAATSGCDQNAVQLIAGPQAGGANVKFFNFAVGSPAVNFYVNDEKATAVSTTACSVLSDANRDQCTTAGLESTSGVAYGSAGNGANAWYSDVTPGQVTLQGKIAAATDKNLAISNLSATVADGKFYSFYQSGIYDATAKTADSFIVEDPIPPIKYDGVHIRFVNAVPNAAGPLTLYIVFPSGATQALGGEVAYKSAGEFTAIQGFGTANVVARYAGSDTNVISRTGVAFLPGRVYTITARGNLTVASTVSLDNTANW